MPGGRSFVLRRLRGVATNAIRLGLGGDRRIADRERADRRRRRQVALEQRRRHAEHVSVVVEAVGRIVRRQQRRRYRRSSASRSRIAFAYSARFRRCGDGRPGLGCVAAARSSVVSRNEISAACVAASGRGIPAGGIAPACSFRITFSHIAPSVGDTGEVRRVEDDAGRRRGRLRSRVVAARHRSCVDDLAARTVGRRCAAGRLVPSGCARAESRVRRQRLLRSQRRTTPQPQPTRRRSTRQIRNL